MKTIVVKANSKQVISTAVRVLRHGGIVIYPTETAYGMAVDATSIKAIKKLRHAKKRRSEKLIPIIISDMSMARRYIVLSKGMEKLVKRFMPGPLTLVCKKKMRTAKLLGGFRIPGNKFAFKLVKKFGKPLTATSANLSKQLPNYKIKDIKRIFTGRVALIIDAGNLKKRKPSTVYDIETNEIIRKGRITLRQISAAIST